MIVFDPGIQSLILTKNLLIETIMLEIKRFLLCGILSSSALCLLRALLLSVAIPILILYTEGIFYYWDMWLVLHLVVVIVEVLQR